MDGAQMKALRTRHGLTQKQLAEILGVSPGYVGNLERDHAPMTERIGAKLSEWDGDAPLDELPEPPYDPSDPTAVGADADDEPSPSSRSSSGGKTSAPTVRKLTSIQKEAAMMLETLLRGQAIEIPNADQPLVIPGAAHLVNAVWCPICANVLGAAAPAVSVAVVRAYPGLAYMLARPEGAKAELVIVLATQVAIPCVMHHIHLEGHGEASANGAVGGNAAEG